MEKSLICIYNDFKEYVSTLQRKRRSGSAYVEEEDYKYYKNLYFLNDFIEHRPATSSAAPNTFKVNKSSCWQKSLSLLEKITEDRMTSVNSKQKKSNSKIVPSNDKFALLKEASRNNVAKNLADFKETIRKESAKVIQQLQGNQSALSEEEKNVNCYVDHLIEELMESPEKEFLRCYTDLINDIGLFKKIA